MLFGGSNPWSGGRMRPVQQQFPLNPVAQPGGGSTGAPLSPSYPTPSWPGATPDSTYSQGLAGFYAGQLPNQQVPGTPQMQPMQQAPGAPPQQMPSQMPPQMPPQMPDWRNAFHQAMGAWRQQLPLQQRPERNAYRMGNM